MAIQNGTNAVKQEEPDYFSDESSFYGDEDIKQELEHRTSTFNAKGWWANRVPSLTEIADANIASATVVKAATQYNPYEGQSYGRQLSESVEEFLRRLPPASTPFSSQTPWIFIANPFRKAPKPENEDELAEGPPDEDSQWARFVVEGGNLLEELVVLRNQIEKEKVGAAKATVTKAVNRQKEMVVERLLDVAVECHCTSGKWMIFCPPQDVNAVWGVVARATANNELGIAAKVAPDEGTAQKERLICIYTHDFSDREDVARVVQKIKELGLIDSRGRGIYYKCDAYTYLRLNSSNEYNIQASLYNSNDFLKTTKGKDVKGKVGGFFYKKKKDPSDWRSVEYD